MDFKNKILAFAVCGIIIFNEIFYSVTKWDGSLLRATFAFIGLVVAILICHYTILGIKSEAQKQ